jgi:hypothetical protein
LYFKSDILYIVVLDPQIIQVVIFLTWYQSTGLGFLYAPIRIFFSSRRYWRLIPCAMAALLLVVHRLLRRSRVYLPTPACAAHLPTAAPIQIDPHAGRSILVLIMLLLSSTWTAPSIRGCCWTARLASNSSCSARPSV